ncbi:MAG: hypothetical protein IJW20_06525 [Clostridia bacterium]|nr:hypothetical protein [Clostridia bacterium]
MRNKSYLVPLLGFVLISIIGAVVLCLPICNKAEITFHEAFYASVSTVTGTALLKTPIVEQFSVIGQIVILMLMEVGALGFIVFISYFWAKRNKKMKMSDIIMVNDNTGGDNNYNTIKEHSMFVFNLVLRVQIIGAVLLGIRFIPEFGLIKGIWYGIFHSISAFTNVGYDIIGTSSLYNYKSDIYLQIVLMILMLLGSIGIFAIEDLKKHKFKSFNKLRLQTKIILVYSLIFTLVPAILLKIFEPQMSILNSLFMALTARSAGFTLINLESFSIASKLLLIVVMFIGGSPASTAGGMRVIVPAIIFSTVISTLRGRENTVMFWKKIPNIVVRKAFAIFIIFLMLSILASMLLAYCNKEVTLLEVIFETVSALTNAGLAVAETTSVNAIGDWLLLILMFIGRIGPIAMVMAFVHDEPVDKLVDYPTENVMLY